MTGAPALSPQPWLTAPETRRLLGALGGDGTEVRFVGGCVRDAIAGRASTDIDVATPDPPATVTAKLAAAGLRAIPTGIDHGTVTALVGDARFEITTLRRDVATDGRRAQVAFTDDWREDAARRDFTMNALSATPDGRVHDYFGGVDDLAAGRVVFVGEPERRIAEDHLRVLRFYRFHAWFGRGAPDASARAACRAAVGLLHRLSGERIRAELLKLLGAPLPAATVAAMAEDGVLVALSPSLADTATLAALQALEAPADRDAMRRLAALIPGSTAAEGVRVLADSLRLSTAERDRLLATRAASEIHAAAGDAAALRRLLHRLGREAVVDGLLVGAARARADRAPTEALERARTTRLPDFPLRGGDALALGLAPGPRVGALLAAVERWWVEADFAPDRAACLAELSRRAAVDDR